LISGIIQEQLLHINKQRFRGGLVFKADRLLYYSTLGWRVIKKKKKKKDTGASCGSELSRSQLGHIVDQAID